MNLNKNPLRIYRVLWEITTQMRAHFLKRLLQSLLLSVRQRPFVARLVHRIPVFHSLDQSPEKFSKILSCQNDSMEAPRHATLEALWK